MNIVARSVPFIFIFYLSWNFIYVRWTGSSHSLDALVFTVWFTQLIHVCCCCLWVGLWVGEEQAKLIILAAFIDVCVVSWRAPKEKHNSKVMITYQYEKTNKRPSNMAASISLFVACLVLLSVYKNCSWCWKILASRSVLHNCKIVISCYLFIC